MAQADSTVARAIGMESPMSIGARLDAQQIDAALRRDGRASESVLAQSDEGGAVTEALLQPLPEGTEAALIYYSGPLDVGPDGTILLGADGGGVSLPEVTSALGTTAPIIVALEDCFAMDGAAGALTGAATTGLGAGVTLLTSAGPDGRCRIGAQRVTDRLASGDPGRGGDVHVLRAETGGAPVPPNLGVWSALALGPDASALAQLRAAPRRTPSNDDIRLVRYDPNDPTPIFDWGADGVRAPSAGSAQALLVRRQLEDPIIDRPPPGKPQPSILIGLLPEEAERGDTDNPLALYADRPTRDALRRRDPDTFDLLLSAGSLDPPQEPADAREELLRRARGYFSSRVDRANFDPVSRLLAFSLQAELEQMRCYRSGLDGDWGNRSRSAAGRYYDTRGVPRGDLGSTLPFWRDMISNDAVVCPAPQPQSSASSGGSRSSGSRPSSAASSSSASSGTTSRPSRTREPQRAPAPAQTVVIPFN